MKKITTIILALALMIPTTAAFADEREELTFTDLEQISEKYGIEPVILDQSSDIPESLILKDITKEELEELIVKARTEAKQPLIFEENVMIEKVSNDEALSLSPDETNRASNFMTMSSSGWTTINRTTTLSRTSYLGQIQEFQVYAAVAASYQFENCTLPGEGGTKRNFKFISCDNGSLEHLNRGAYELKSYTSNANVASSGSMITQSYQGVYNLGTYVSIKGFPVRIPLTDNNFSGTINYSISEVQ